MPNSQNPKEIISCASLMFNSSSQFAVMHLHSQVLDRRPEARTWFTIHLWSREKIRKYLRMCCQNGSGYSHSSGPRVGYTRVFQLELIKYWGFLFKETWGGSTVQHCSEWKLRLCTRAPNSRCIDLTVKVLTYGNVARRPHFAPIYATVCLGLCWPAMTTSNLIFSTAHKKK